MFHALIMITVIVDLRSDALIKPQDSQQIQEISTLPVCGQTLPKGDFSLGADCHNPSMGRTFSLGADTDIRIEAKPQQETTQQNCMVLTVLEVIS